jgi:hypothetical protein
MHIMLVATAAAMMAIGAGWSVSTFAKHKMVSKVEATDASATISPHEIMVKQGRSLPFEYWAHPF